MQKYNNLCACTAEKYSILEDYIHDNLSLSLSLSLSF